MNRQWVEQDIERASTRSWCVLYLASTLTWFTSNKSHNKSSHWAQNEQFWSLEQGGLPSLAQKVLVKVHALVIKANTEEMRASLGKCTYCLSASILHKLPQFVIHTDVSVRQCNPPTLSDKQHTVHSGDHSQKCKISAYNNAENLIQMYLSTFCLRGGQSKPCP